jgi:hypothetical protein
VEAREIGAEGGARRRSVRAAGLVCLALCASHPQPSCLTCGELTRPVDRCCTSCGQAIDIKTAKATNEDDRQRILKYIERSYESLDEFNEMLKLLFLLVRNEKAGEGASPVGLSGSRLLCRFRIWGSKSMIGGAQRQGGVAGCRWWGLQGLIPRLDRSTGLLCPSM